MMRDHVWDLMFRLGSSRRDGRWMLPSLALVLAALAAALLVLLAAAVLAEVAMGATVCGGGGSAAPTSAVVTAPAPRTVTSAAPALMAHGPVAAVMPSVEVTGSTEATGPAWWMPPEDCKTMEDYHDWLLTRAPR